MWLTFCIVATGAAAALRWALRASGTSSSLPPFVGGVVIDDTAVRQLLGIPLAPGLYANWDTHSMEAEHIGALVARLRVFRDACDLRDLSKGGGVIESNAHPAIKFAAFAGGGQEMYEAALSVYFHPRLAEVGFDALYSESRDAIVSIQANTAQ